MERRNNPSKIMNNNLIASEILSPPELLRLLFAKNEVGRVEKKFLKCMVNNVIWFGLSIAFISKF